MMNQEIVNPHLENLQRMGAELKTKWATEEAEAARIQDEYDRDHREKFPDYTPQKGVAREQGGSWILEQGPNGVTTAQFAQHFDITEAVATELLEFIEANDIGGFSKWTPLKHIGDRWVHYEHFSE